VCGLALSRRALPRPLLFQAGAIQGTPKPEPRPQAISAPALGRVVPIQVEEPLEAPAMSDPLHPPLPLPPAPLPQPAEMSETSFWRLVRVELSEFLILGLINGLFWLLAAILSHVPLGRLYGELWPFLLPVHLGLSWAFVMVPMALTGQSPMMGPQGLLLDTGLP
jgi:hypothetical protein